MCFCAALSVALAHSAFALTAITTISRASGCSGGSVGFCVFSLTHLFLQPPGCHSAVKRCSWRTLSVRRTPARALCSLRLHLAQAPCRHRCLALWLFLFLRCHTKGTASSCTVCCLVCNSVQVCSRTARSSELPHLLPPCGARCALVPMNMCCLVFLLTGLSPLQLCLPRHFLFV